MRSGHGRQQTGDQIDQGGGDGCLDEIGDRAEAQRLLKIARRTGGGKHYHAHLFRSEVAVIAEPVEDRETLATDDVEVKKNDGGHRELLAVSKRDFGLQVVEGL